MLKKHRVEMRWSALRSSSSSTIKQEQEKQTEIVAPAPSELTTDFVSIFSIHILLGVTYFMSPSSSVAGARSGMLNCHQFKTIRNRFNLFFDYACTSPPPFASAGSNAAMVYGYCCFKNIFIFKCLCVSFYFRSSSKYFA